jgi:hypothetical protein
MHATTQIINLLPLGCVWAEEQERYILANGMPLNEEQRRDAYIIGVKEIDKVRLLKVDQIPVPEIPELKDAVQLTGFLAPGTIGVSFRYGIYIKADHWNKRSLLVHELTHTMQYEQLGGFKPFLMQYVQECLTVGYQKCSLELEARSVEAELCSTLKSSRYC